MPGLCNGADALLCCLDEKEAAIRFAKAFLGSAHSMPLVWVLPESCEESAREFLQHRKLEWLPNSASPQLIALTIEKALARHSRREEQHRIFESSIDGAVAAFFEILSIVDPYSASLGQRLRYAVDLFAKSAGFELEWELETAALLAEVGVLTVPVRVLLKSQSGQELSGFEQDLVAHIPERGSDLLRQMPSFREAARIVRYQGKNYDGGGLPRDNYSGEKIPRGARILKVIIDLFKLKENGLNHEQAIEDMRGRNGRYDPEVLETACECFQANLPEQLRGSSTVPLTLKDLRPGQMLVSSVETDDGVLLVRDGQVISPRLLHKLRNFAFTSGIREPIYVIDLLESPKMTTAFHDLAHSETTFLSRA
jgi:response regulator RpfG family c-di-GMP phosphodiesterase